MKYYGSIVDDNDIATKKYVDDTVAGGGGGGGAEPSTTTPLADGTAAVGTETKYARGDHRHPTDTTRAPINAPSFTGNASIGGSLTLGGHSSAVGTKSGPSTNTSQVSLSATSNKNIVSRSFEAGTWLILCTVRITKPSQASYVRLNCSNTSADANTRDAAAYLATSDDTVITFPKVFVLTSTTTLYLNAYVGRATNVPANGATITGYRLV